MTNYLAISDNNAFLIRLQEIFDTSLDGILIVDSQGKIISFNNKFREIWNIPVEILQNSDHEEAIHYVLDLLIDPQEFSNRINYLYEHKEMKSREEILLKDGRILDRYSATIYGLNNKYYGRIWYYRDISQQRLAERKLAESDRLKSAFLTNMSHEIRTPMNAIMGFANLLPEADDMEREKYSEIILNNSNQLLNIIDDVIYASRLQSEKYPIKITDFKPSDLVESIFSLVDLPENTRNFEIKVKIPYQYNHVRISSDKDKIRHILTILLSNALKYTFEGEVEIGFDIHGTEIEFYVSDTGIGIPENERPHLFNPFFRGQKAISNVIGGTGLGLNIAKMLIDLLGGHIAFEARQSGGSLFYFTVPLTDSLQLAPEIPAAAKPKVKLTECKILIAEDENDSFLYLNVLLKNLVKKVDRARNGSEAIVLAAENQYDIVFMDLKMPEMGGIEATELIRKTDPDIPIIAQTAYATLDEKDSALRAGFTDYLTKPIRKEELMDMVYKYYVEK